MERQVLTLDDGIRTRVRQLERGPPGRAVHLGLEPAALLFVSSCCRLWSSLGPPPTSGRDDRAPARRVRRRAPYSSASMGARGPGSRRLPATAAVPAEDQHYSHAPRFEFESLQRAIDAHEEGGASGRTRFQQVAKNVFCGGAAARAQRSRSLLHGADRAMCRSGGSRGLLNVAELGPGVFGVERQASVSSEAAAS